MRIWVVGDSDVRTMMPRLCGMDTLNLPERHTDLWLIGDNAYDTGTFDEYQHAVFDMYPELLRRSVLWTAIGNP